MTIVHSPDAGLIERHLRQTLGNAAADYAREAYRDPGQLAQRLGCTPLFADPNDSRRVIVSGCTFLSEQAEADRAASLFDVLRAEAGSPVFLTVASEKLLARHAEVGRLLKAVEAVYLPKLTD